MGLLTEEDRIHFDRYEQLSYQNKGNFVELFVDDFYIGDMVVWQDREMDNREYLTINYEIIYLDTLKQQ